MMHYVLGVHRLPIRSPAYCQHMSTFGFHPLAATSMTALGLIGISNFYHDFSFKREALRWYSKALQMTNAALASPAEAKSDTTLFATMLLSVFEATSNERSLIAWSNHIAGSESLIRMRGTKQFTSPSGRRMFKQVVSLATMNYMGMGKKVPDYILAMNKEIQKYEKYDDPANRFYHLHIDVVNFRAEVKQGDITDLRLIIERALELDKVAKTIFECQGPDWDYIVVQDGENNPSVFSNIYHIYPHMASALVWNWVRYNRIYIHDIIRNCLLTGFSMNPPVFFEARYTSLLQECQETLYQMQHDIIASIPQHLFDTPKSFSADLLRSDLQSTSPSIKFLWSNFSKQDVLIQPLEHDFSEDQIPVVRTSGGHSSLWALYVAGSTPIATPESQQFIITSLSRVSSEFGIHQAKILGNALKLKIHLDNTGQQPFELVPSYLPERGEHFED